MTLPAARMTDMTACPMTTGPVPHVGGPLMPPGEPTVLIGALPSIRVGDMGMCIGPPSTVMVGEPSVLIGNKPAARMSDSTTHNGKIVLGCPTVLIGSNAQGVALASASASGDTHCDMV